jgi:hypothetical protein
MDFCGSAGVGLIDRSTQASQALTGPQPLSAGHYNCPSVEPGRPQETAEKVAPRKEDCNLQFAIANCKLQIEENFLP